MGKEKAGFLTPKAISNRIKAKGLQKLRWYCEMCQKQCRDENGFKCHLTSESHQRQLLLFAENPDEYIDSFSKEFLDCFMELLSRRFGTKRVGANVVYQEYISDRQHTHMNSTQWETLSEFVKWLGREGHCTVDHTEKGWFIQYIDRSPEVLKRQAEAQKKEKMELDDEERTAKFIQQQIERAKAGGTEAQKAEYTELQRESEEEKVTFSLGITKPKEEPISNKLPVINPLKTAPKDTSGKPEASGSGSKMDSFKKPSTSSSLKRKSALDEIIELEQKKKEKMNRKDHWLHPGIVVKVMTKKLGEKYYKKKAYVKEVIGTYGGLIKMLDSGDKLKVDQTHLETVIPAIGKPVLVLNGAYRGSEAVLLGLDEDTFSCSVRINSGSLKGKKAEGIKYEDISKIHIIS